MYLIEKEGKLFASVLLTGHSTDSNLDTLNKDDLLNLFWKADYLPFEDKQKLVTYLNARGHNLKLFRGEMRGELHYTTEYFDGTDWKEYKPSYVV